MLICKPESGRIHHIGRYFDGVIKTTLAAALCHDPAVRAAFPGGIFWVSLGEQPVLLTLLTGLYTALTDVQGGAADVETAAEQLARVWPDQACLLVIDDVWREPHLHPFLQGGPGCRRLITTRNFALAESAGAECIRVDEMSGDEAVELLTNGLNAPPAELPPFRALAARLGAWPLLLALANGLLRYRRNRNDTLAGALAYVNRALDQQGVWEFDDRQNKDARRRAVARSMGASLDLLTDEERERYITLAIFPEDVDIPLSAARVLWELDAPATEEAATHLNDLSLLKLDLGGAGVRLHDVVRQYLAAQLREQGSATAALHARLVDAWPDFHHLPNTYAWRYLAYHLAGAGRLADLRRLLFDFSWLHARLAADRIAALVADSDYLPADPAIRQVQDALRLAAHVLADDPAQLAAQLLGRLANDDGAEIARLLAQARHGAGRPWLRPLTPILTPPGGPLLRTLTGHSGEVRAVAVTPDGHAAVSASADGTLRVWDLTTGAAVRTLSGHSRRVTAVAVTPDGRAAVSAAADGTLRVWDLATGVPIARFDGESAFYCCAVAPDERTIIAGDALGRVHFLRLEGI